MATLNVDLKDGGNALINGQSYGGLVTFEPDRDVFHYQVFEEEGSFVNQLTVTVTYPREVNPEQVVARHFASFGVETPVPEVISANQVNFTALNLSPAATYRIELVLPKGTITPSLYRATIDGLSNLPASIWLAIALALPILASLVLAGMLLAARRTWRAPASDELRPDPPAKVSPAVVGVLLEGKVSPRSLAATLLSLAQRGHLVVTHRKDGFSFGRRKTLDAVDKNAGEQAAKVPGADELSNFEKVLIDKMFLPESTRSTMSDIQLRIGRHVYSRKIAEIYLDMYGRAVELGWFVRDPQAVYRRFHQAALAVIGASGVGFLLSLFLGPEPRFYLLGWAGLFFVGVVMYRVTPFLPRRTAKGDNAYREWIEFKNYLSSTQSLSNISEPQKLYERYLPYAVMFGVEVEWTERFRELPFQVPNWYVATEEIHAIEDFANSLFPFIGTVAYDLSKAREPYAI